MKESMKVIPFPKIENAYIVISGWKNNKLNKVKSEMSFLYADKTIGVEWEPNYGPITVLYQCGEKHPEAEEHWFFGYITGQQHWSQLAVNENNLGELFYTGQYEKLFNILKEWCN